MEETNQLVDLTNQMLISFFDTEIECNEEKESEKEDQILLDIQKEKSENESIKTVSSNIKACISLSLGEMMDKANDIFISKMQLKIEQKFIKYHSKKTLSIIKGIEKYGKSCNAEFFL